MSSSSCSSFATGLSSRLSRANNSRRQDKTNSKRRNTTTTKCQTSQTASFTPKGAKISGVGKALPKKFITNDDLAKLVETNDEWIRTRTGIGKRHVISGDETLTSLAAEASLGALKMANVNPEDIDLIIVATSSPDDLFGSAGLILKNFLFHKNPFFLTKFYYLKIFQMPYQNLALLFQNLIRKNLLPVHSF